MVDPTANDDMAAETNAAEHTDGPAGENEVLREARRAKELAERAIAKVGWKTAAGIGIGVGSAALLAALLYSGRGKGD